MQIKIKQWNSRRPEGSFLFSQLLTFIWNNIFITEDKFISLLWYEPLLISILLILIIELHEAQPVPGRLVRAQRRKKMIGEKQRGRVMGGKGLVALVQSPFFFFFFRLWYLALIRILRCYSTDLAPAGGTGYISKKFQKIDTEMLTYRAF